jgi:hypothetical protein
MGTVVTEPGVYQMPDHEYHADPVPGGSLSVTGARKLLPPSCPAKFRYWVDHGDPPKADYDFGHAAHEMVLGIGQGMAVIDAADWRTKAAKQQRDEAYADGAAPILRADYEHVVAMADALRAHPVAAALFDPERGEAEQALFWIDDTTGIWRRARLDWLPYYIVHTTGGVRHGGRLIIPDYKTCNSADPAAIEKAIYAYGYHQQAAQYIDGVRALFPAYRHPDAEDPAFVFVFQEKTPPYLVTIAEPDAMALRIGRNLNRQAIEVYRQCVARGEWPSYSDDVIHVGLPAWAENAYLKENW